MYRVNQYPPPPPPPRGSSTALILGIVLACIGVASIVGAIVIVKRGSKAASAPVGAPSTAASASAPSTGETEASRVPVPAAPEEEDPAVTGTPASSLRARPEWARFPFISPHAPPTDEYAPQLKDPLPVYLAAAPLVAEVARGFLICRFQSFGKSDAFMGDDLHARAKFGATPEMANDGPEDANLAFVSAPLATLKRGQTAKFGVFDRDVFELEPITRPQVAFDTKGLSVTDSGANIECRSLAGDTLSRLVKEQIAKADVSLGDLRKHKIDVSEPDGWGWPVIEMAGARAAVGDAAAFVGWDDARVHARTTALEDLAVALDKDRATAFAALYAKAGNEGDAHGLRVQFVELACGAKKLAIGGDAAASRDACLAHVSLRNETAAPITLRSGYDLTVHLATAKGPAAATIYDAHGAPAALMSLAPKTPDDAFIGLAAGDVADGPALASVCVSGACAWVKIR